MSDYCRHGVKKIYPCWVCGAITRKAIIWSLRMLAATTATILFLRLL